MRLVDLAMDAHAVAYIAVISSLYQQPRVSKRTIKKLTEYVVTTIFLIRGSRVNVCVLHQAAGQDPYVSCRGRGHEEFCRAPQKDYNLEPEKGSSTEYARGSNQTSSTD